MGIFGLWMLWRNNELLEEIRRNQLTPAERAAEDRALEAEAKAAEKASWVTMVVAIVVLSGGLAVAWLIHVFHLLAS